MAQADRLDPKAVGARSANVLLSRHLCGERDLWHHF